MELVQGGQRRPVEAGRRKRSVGGGGYNINNINQGTDGTQRGGPRPLRQTFRVSTAERTDVCGCSCPRDKRQ